MYQDRGVDSSLTGGTALCPSAGARNFIFSLVRVKPRKTHVRMSIRTMTEKLLTQMYRIKTNLKQTKKLESKMVNIFLPIGFNINEPRHEISNNVVCATSKASDQPAHMRSLIRAFASRLNIL